MRNQPWDSRRAGTGSRKVILSSSVLTASCFAVVALVAGARGSAEGSVGSPALNPARVVSEVRLPYELAARRHRPGGWLEIGSLDGSKRRQLTPATVKGERRQDTRPAFSPDGSKLVFVRSGAGRHNGLYLVNADGSKLRRLAAGNVWDVLWSPDGTRVALSLETRPHGCGPDVIALVSVAGGEVRPLARVPTWDTSSLDPYVFSPDGAGLVYRVARNDDDCRSSGFREGELMMVAADGSDRPRLLVRSEGAFDISGAAFSPDGGWVAYTDGCEERCDLYVIRPNRGPPRQLSHFSKPAHPGFDGPDEISFAWAGRLLLYGRGGSLLALEPDTANSRHYEPRRLARLPGCRGSCRINLRAVAADGRSAWIDHDAGNRNWIVHLDAAGHGVGLTSYAPPRPLEPGTVIDSYAIELPSGQLP